MPSVSAEDDLSEAHLNRIRTNCVAAKNSLNQLHANDALLRVNRGQMYEAISVKLMASMNSRIALNRLDGGEMVKITADYNRQLEEFRSSYQVYEQALSRLMRIDCAKKPAEFYSQVGSVRDLREEVNENVKLLHDGIKEYKAAFDKFSSEFKGEDK